MLEQAIKFRSYIFKKIIAIVSFKLQIILAGFVFCRHILGHHTCDLVAMDKLRIVFSGTNLLSYTISHLVIRELYISAT